MPYGVQATDIPLRLECAICDQLKLSEQADTWYFIVRGGALLKVSVALKHRWLRLMNCRACFLNVSGGNWCFLGSVDFNSTRFLPFLHVFAISSLFLKLEAFDGVALKLRGRQWTVIFVAWGAWKCFDALSKEKLCWTVLLENFVLGWVWHYRSRLTACFQKSRHILATNCPCAGNIQGIIVVILFCKKSALYDAEK